MKRACLAFLLLAPAVMLVTPPCSAGTITVNINEFTGTCNQNTGCTVTLNFTPVTGQVRLTDNGVVLDVITFTSTGYIFASDNLDGFDSPADTFGPPAPVTNVVTLVEPVNGGPQVYTPSAGQPGFINSFHPVTYNITSDIGAEVPEPSTLVLLGSGLFVLARRMRTQRA